MNCTMRGVVYQYIYMLKHPWPAWQQHVSQWEYSSPALVWQIKNNNNITDNHILEKGNFTYSTVNIHINPAGAKTVLLMD